MAWLVCDARVLASADVTDDRSTRRRGLLGRDSIDGALVIEGCRWVHTIGMKFAIDVAYLDENRTVIKIEHLKQHRVSAPVKAARAVVEAEWGAFERWGLSTGDQIEIRVSGGLEPPTAR